MHSLETKLTGNKTVKYLYLYVNIDLYKENRHQNDWFNDR